MERSWARVEIGLGLNLLWDYEAGEVKVATNIAAGSAKLDWVTRTKHTTIHPQHRGDGRSCLRPSFGSLLVTKAFFCEPGVGDSGLRVELRATRLDACR